MIKSFSCWFLQNIIYISQWRWLCFQAATLLIFFAFMFLYYYRSKKNEGVLELLFLFSLFFVTIFLCHLPISLCFEINPDEGQWIAQANNFASDPLFWLNYFLPREFSRVLTIIPLACVSLVVGPIGYLETRLFTLLIWAGFTFLFYRSLICLFERDIALYCSTVLILITSLMSSGDLVSYNSEMPVIFLLMLAFFFYVTTIKNSSPPLRFISLGFILLLIPFAKEQAFIIVVAFELLIVISYWYLDRKTGIYYLLAGNFLGFAFCIWPYLFYSNLGVVQLQIQSTLDYSKLGISGNEFGIFHKPLRFIATVFDMEYRFLTIPALLIIPVFCGVLVKKQIKIRQEHKIVFAIVTILFAVTCFSIYLPTDIFTHYGILLLFPSAILFSFFIFLVQSWRKSYLPKSIFTILLILIFVARKIHPDVGITSMYYNCNAEYKNLLSEYMVSNSKPKERMLIWGWNSSYYVETGLFLGSRAVCPIHILDNYSNKNKFLAMYLEDLKTLKPKFILELIGPDQFMFTDYKTQSISNFPILYHYVSQHYRLEKMIKNERLYILKD